MEFVYDLVRRQLNEALIVETGEKEFCVFSEKMQKNPEDIINRVNHSVEEFLGVRFRVQKGTRKEGEDPRFLSSGEGKSAGNVRGRPVRSGDRRCLQLYAGALSGILKSYGYFLCVGNQFQLFFPSF